jgi:hypothetical protein
MIAGLAWMAVGFDAAFGPPEAAQVAGSAAARGHRCPARLR